MGLDNGIYIKKKNEEEKMELSGKNFFWGNEIAYWRKCYGIRRVILNTLGGEKNGEYKYFIKVCFDNFICFFGLYFYKLLFDNLANFSIDFAYFD